MRTTQRLSELNLLLHKFSDASLQQVSKTGTEICQSRDIRLHSQPAKVQSFLQDLVGQELDWS